MAEGVSAAESNMKGNDEAAKGAETASVPFEKWLGAAAAAGGAAASLLDTPAPAPAPGVNDGVEGKTSAALELVYSLCAAGKTSDIGAGDAIAAAAGGEWKALCNSFGMSPALDVCGC